MVLRIPVRRNYGWKSPVSIKCHNLHSFKGVIFLCQRPWNGTDITFKWLSSLYNPFPSRLKLNNRNTKTRCEICLKLTIKTSVTSSWYLYCKLWTYFTPCSSVSIFNFELVNAGCEVILQRSIQESNICSKNTILRLPRISQ